ncbi:hypothetical protein [Mycolicibacterium sphagni]|uniref:hypothetical protein n=1 Tax=Mycolicibacterium sphagni TaxID=1786 RepID=UPI001055BA68|nr:hypothetical protein [Mycolicibacterium sphagni]
MDAGRRSRSTTIAAAVGFNAALAGGVLVAATQVERGGPGSVLSDPGSTSAPAPGSMTTGVTTRTSPGQPSASPSVATPQITTTPTSATPG